MPQQFHLLLETEFLFILYHQTFVASTKYFVLCCLFFFFLNDLSTRSEKTLCWYVCLIYTDETDKNIHKCRDFITLFYHLNNFKHWRTSSASHPITPSPQMWIRSFSFAEHHSIYSMLYCWKLSSLRVNGLQQTHWLSLFKNWLPYCWLQTLRTWEGMFCCDTCCWDTAHKLRYALPFH